MQNNTTTSKSFFNVMLAVFVLCNVFLLKNILIGLHESFNIAVMVLGFSIYIPLLINIKKKTFFLFDPKNILPIWFSLMYYISSIPIYSVYNPTEFYTTMLFNPLNEDNIVVYYTLSFGILLFYFGYGITNIFLKKNVINYNIDLNRIIRFRGIVFKFYSFSIIFRCIGYFMGFLGSISSTGGGTSLPSIPFISIFFFIANSWSIYLFYFACASFTTKKNKNTFLMFLFFELSFMMLSGHRRNLIVMFFIYSLAFYMVKKYLPITKNLRYVIPILIFVLPFITIYGYLLPSLSSYNLQSLLGLVSVTFNKLTSISFATMFLDYFLYPILQSFNYFSTVGIAYTEFTQKGVSWGAVGPQNLISKLVPSFIFPSSFDERGYYQMFSAKAMSYNVDYSNLTFTAQSEQMLSFGLKGVLMGMFSQGVISSFLFKKFNSFNTPFFLRIVYLGLLFKFTINFCSGLLVSDLILGFRLLFYAIIIFIVYKMFKK